MENRQNENAEILDKINSLAMDILKDWRWFFGLIKESSVMDSTIYATNYTLFEYDERVSAVMTYAASIKEGKGVNLSLLSKSSLKNSLSSLEASKAQLDGIKSIVDSLMGQGQAIARLEISNSHIYTVAGSAYNIQPYLSTFLSQIDVFMQNISTLVPFMKMYSSYNLSQAVKDYADLNNKFEILIEEIDKFAQSLGEIEKRQIDSTNEMTAMLDGGRRNIEDILKINSEAKNILNRIESVNDEIDSISEESEKIFKAVELYENKFDSFDKELDHRNILFASFEKYYDEMKKNNSELVDKIGENLDRTDLLLKGATVAAIASAFTSAHDDYKNRAKGAMLVYFGTIVLLVLCIIPIAIYVYPGQISGWASIFKGDQVEISGVIARSIIALPAILLVSFAGKRYNQLFDLEREYAHRSTLAKSVNAFKMEAPTNSEAITTAVFIELQRNPLDRTNKEDEETVKLKESQLNKLTESLTNRLADLITGK